MQNILTITTNPCIDRTVWVSELVPEKKLRVTKTEVEPGGGGINVARAIKEMKGNTTALYAKGGYTGLFFKELLEAENLPTQAITIKENTRENTLIIDETSLFEYRIGMPGPTISEQEQNQFLKCLQQQNIFNFWVLSGSLNANTSVEFYKSMAILAIQKQVNLVVDTSGEALQELIKLPLFLVKPNLNELSKICGKPLLSIQEIISEAKQIANTSNIKNMVISLGKEGAIILSKKGIFKATPPAVNVKSTVGAGDCMVAGITHAFCNGKNEQEALMQGIACGTAATLYSGYGLCQQEDVNAILPKIILEVLE